MCERTHNPAMVGIDVKLHNKDIWKQFHQHTTEMIITKSGRRMFPYLRLEVSGLDPDARYFILLELNLSSTKRFKFNGVQWTPIGNAEPQLPPSSRLYVHPDSPALGRHWMSQSVLFNKIKLTNHTLDRSGNIVLTSMHKYLPCVHIVMATDVLAVQWSPTATFRFPETEFVAVTAYQNEKITKLKIDNNPFAKGFRETGQSRLKRRLQQTKDVENEVQEVKKRSSPLPVTASPDSGISSIGSPNGLSLSDEDSSRQIAVFASVNTHHERLMPPQPLLSRYTTSHVAMSHNVPWMDLPIPPCSLIPPYCPRVSHLPHHLWPYPPFLLQTSSSSSSPPHCILPPHIIPYNMPLTSTPVSEPCLIDLSIKRNS